MEPGGCGQSQCTGKRTPRCSDQRRWPSYRTKLGSAEAANRLSKLYQGHFDVTDLKPNETVSSNVAFADLLGAHKKQPGVYMMTIANPADPYAQPQTLGFTVSNIGLSAYLTPAGLWIEARDLSSAKPLDGRRFTLYAYNKRHTRHDNHRRERHGALSAGANQR